jgi:hypothetical protein
MAELIVAAELVKRGYRVAFPYGEDCDFDLLFWQPPSIDLERVQVKYAQSDEPALAAAGSGTEQPAHRDPDGGRISRPYH